MKEKLVILREQIGHNLLSSEAVCLKGSGFSRLRDIYPDRGSFDVSNKKTLYKEIPSVTKLLCPRLG